MFMTVLSYCDAIVDKNSVYRHNAFVEVPAIDVCRRKQYQTLIVTGGNKLVFNRVKLISYNVIKL